MQPHHPVALPLPRRCLRAVWRPRAPPARRAPRLSGPRPPHRGQREPGILLRLGGPAAAHRPDEGDGGPRARPRGGQRRTGGAAGQREGPRRERDDRGPAAQRPRARERGGQRAGHRAAPRRAVPDPVAADLPDPGPPATGDRPGRGARGALPLRLDHRGAEAVHHGADRRARGRPARRVLRGARVSRSRPGAPGALQRRDPHRGDRWGRRLRGLRRRWRDHLGLDGRCGVRRAAGQVSCAADGGAGALRPARDLRGHRRGGAESRGAPGADARFG